MGLPPEEERALVVACLAGHDRAWERLVAEYSAGALASARAALGRSGRRRDAALEDEVVADTFATLAENDASVLRSFRGDAKLGAFIAVIAARRAFRAIRSRVRDDRTLERAGQARGDEARPDDAPALLEHTERTAIVAEALAKLPPSDRLLVVGYYLDGLSYRELGELVGGEVSGIGTRIARARARLRAELGRSGARSLGLEDED